MPWSVADLAFARFRSELSPDDGAFGTSGGVAVDVGQALRKENALKTSVYGDFDRLGKEMAAWAQGKIESLESKTRAVYLVQKHFCDVVKAETLGACDPSMSTCVLAGSQNLSSEARRSGRGDRGVRGRGGRGGRGGGRKGGRGVGGKEGRGGVGRGGRSGMDGEVDTVRGGGGRGEGRWNEATGSAVEEGGGGMGENRAWESRSSSGWHSSPPHNFPALADHNTSVTPPDPSASSGTFQHQRPTPFAGYDGAHGAEAWTRANFGAGAQLPSIRTAQGWGVDMLSTHHYGTGGRASCGGWNVGTTSDGLAAGDTAAGLTSRGTALVVFNNGRPERPKDMRRWRDWCCCKERSHWCRGGDTPQLVLWQGARPLVLGQEVRASAL